MGGIFGVASKSDCVMDLFFGVDYHSHLGTKRGGMAVSNGESFSRAIHNIENSPFRTKFEHDVEDLHGNLGIGCISDEDPQPLLIQSHLGSFAITTVGKISNQKEIIEELYKTGPTYFLEQSGSRINATEIAAVLINQKSTFEEGIEYAQDVIKGSMTDAEGHRSYSEKSRVLTVRLLKAMLSLILATDATEILVPEK